jgi:hypothetical protein
MVVRDFLKMAKRKTTEEPVTPQTPARRRAPAKKLTTTAPEPATANATTTAPGTTSEHPRTASEPTQAEIAEAAYYRHLNRGASGGDEFSDWVEAERELRQRR